MRIQLISDLHLETEVYAPEPVSGADLLVIAGDLDSTWDAFARFRDWPQPVLFVAGNHEFDGRDVDRAWDELRWLCEAHRLDLVERERRVMVDRDGRRIRFVGTTRWCDFDLFGPAGREKAMRAATYFMELMASTRDGRPYDADAVRVDALACRAWLERELAVVDGAWDATVVVTHFAPSLRSADPRYGARAGTASFCNADDDLIGAADLWLHGHLHCRHDYLVAREGGGATRVVCQARGHASKGEAGDYEPRKLIEV
jgi:hypothetical protein